MCMKPQYELSASYQEEIFYEPIVSTRYVCWVVEDELIPAYLVKMKSKPRWKRNEDGTFEWLPFEIEAYEPITPNGAHIFYSNISGSEPFDMEIQVLGPVGDIMEKWKITKAKASTVSYNEELNIINTTINYKFATLVY